MSLMEKPAKLKAAVTYDAAADHFDNAPLAFWERHGRRTVERLALRPGSHVLDVGCGTGASLLPAAEAVGPAGRVIGIDVAEKMLERARAKAAAQDLRNVSLAKADMSGSGFPDDSFDAVVSVFSIFFVPEMERQVAELWRMLRPGGQLAVTVWGPRAFEPLVSVFGEALRRLRPDLMVSSRPWERLTEPENLRRLLLEGGTSEPEIDSVSDHQPMSRPADFWTLAMGSGFRWEIDQLTADQQGKVRAQMMQELSVMGASAVETNAIYAIARKA